MWWPLAIAVPLLVAGTALLALKAAARHRQQTEIVPMQLRSSSALFTPSQLARGSSSVAFASSTPDPDREPEPEPIEVAPAETVRAPEESKLSAKQRERIERLMAAVKSEFSNMLESEKRKNHDA